MRITFILPPDGLVGGIRVLAIYALNLAKRGHKVTVIQPRHARPTLRQTIRALRHQHAFPKNLNKSPSYFTDLRHENFTRIKLPHTGPIAAPDVPDGDVVVATWWETAEWVWALPQSKGAKAHFMQDYETWAGQVERVDATCRLAMPKIVIAQWVSKLLETRFGQTAAALVPNAVDTDLFQAPPRGKQAMATVGFVYTPMHNKGVDIAIAALNLARRKLPELRIKTFGSGFTAKLPLPPGTESHFRLPDAALPGFYASCDAWLFPTRIEGFGLPILEAMACRTPVIATPAGAAPELLAEGGGILVPAENASAMAEAIERLLGMPEDQWRKLSDAAHRTATRYTWEDATGRFEAALSAIQHGAAASPGAARPAESPPGQPGQRV